MQETTMGIASESAYTYKSKCHSYILLTLPPNQKLYTDHNSHIAILNYDSNTYAILDPYMNGTGQRDATMRMSVLDLPASRKSQRNISRHQAFIDEQVKLVCENKM